MRLRHQVLLFGSITAMIYATMALEVPGLLANFRRNFNSLFTPPDFSATKKLQLGCNSKAVKSGPAGDEIELTHRGSYK